MAEFNEKDVEACFSRNLQQAKKALSRLEVCSGKEPKFTALSGWVFEKTIRHYIEKELKAKKKKPEIREAVPLYYQKKKKVIADMTVGKIAIELKTTGFYDKMDKVVEWCRKYRNAAKKYKLRPVLLSKFGSSKRLWPRIRRELGDENVFCLFFRKQVEPQEGEWKRFVKLL